MNDNIREDPYKEIVRDDEEDVKKAERVSKVSDYAKEIDSSTLRRHALYFCEHADRLDKSLELAKDFDSNRTRVFRRTITTLSFITIVPLLLCEKLSETPLFGVSARSTDRVQIFLVLACIIFTIFYFFAYRRDERLKNAAEGEVESTLKKCERYLKGWRKVLENKGLPDDTLTLFRYAFTGAEFHDRKVKIEKAHEIVSNYEQQLKDAHSLSKMWFNFDKFYPLALGVIAAFVNASLDYIFPCICISV